MPWRRWKVLDASFEAAVGVSAPWADHSRCPSQGVIPSPGSFKGRTLSWGFAPTMTVLGSYPGLSPTADTRGFLFGRAMFSQVSAAEVRAVRPLGGNAIAVYLALAAHAQVGSDCWPSTTTLIDWSGVHRSQLFVALNRLADAGIVERKTRHGRSTVYSLPMRNGRPEVQDPPVPEAGTTARPVQRDLPVPDRGTQKRSRRDQPEKIKEESPPDVERVHEHWLKLWRERGAKVRGGKKSRAAIEKALDSVTADEACELLTGHSRSEFHLTNGFTDPSYAFRESSYTRFMKLAAEPDSSDGPNRADVLAFWKQAYEDGLVALSNAQERDAPWTGTWSRPVPPTHAARLNGWIVPLWGDAVMDLHSTNLVAARRASKATRERYPGSPVAETVAAEGFESARQDFMEAHSALTEKA